MKSFTLIMPTNVLSSHQNILTETAGEDDVVKLFQWSRWVS